MRKAEKHAGAILLVIALLAWVLFVAAGGSGPRGSGPFEMPYDPYEGSKALSELRALGDVSPERRANFCKSPLRTDPVQPTMSVVLLCQKWGM